MSGITNYGRHAREGSDSQESWNFHGSDGGGQDPTTSKPRVLCQRRNQNRNHKREGIGPCQNQAWGGWFWAALSWWLGARFTYAGSEKHKSTGSISPHPHPPLISLDHPPAPIRKCIPLFLSVLNNTYNNQLCVQYVLAKSLTLFVTTEGQLLDANHDVKLLIIQLI